MPGIVQKMRTRDWNGVYIRKITQDFSLGLLLDNISATLREVSKKMHPLPLSKILLHHVIMRSLLDKGYAPRTEELAAHFGVPRKRVANALSELQDYHGVVLHPNSPEVWVIHPFSTAPTNFAVRLEERVWWGNCAWCSLGIAALLGGNGVRIDSTVGAEGPPLSVHVDGAKVRENLLVHFPVPMTRVWDNVIYADSTVLLFETDAQIETWTKCHRIPRGDTQPIQRVYELGAAWYRHHLDADWHKWTTAEARDIFARLGLKGPIWNLPNSEKRF